MKDGTADTAMRQRDIHRRKVSNVVSTRRTISSVQHRTNWWVVQIDHTVVCLSLTDHIRSSGMTIKQLICWCSATINDRAAGGACRHAVRPVTGVVSTSSGYTRLSTHRPVTCYQFWEWYDDKASSVAINCDEKQLTRCVYCVTMQYYFVSKCS